MGGVSAPSAELGDDPCGPGESIGGRVVLLKLGFALHSLVDGRERIDLFGGEDKLGRQLFAAVAGLNELNDGASGFGGDRDKLGETVGGLQLTVLDAQTL